MKNCLFVCFIFLLQWYAISCQLFTDDTPDLANAKEVAAEIFTHSITTQKTIYLNEYLHSDFLSTEIRNMIEGDSFLKKMLICPGQNQDTIFTFEEIPYSRELKNLTTIYKDGSMESVIDDFSSEDLNPLYELTQNTRNESDRIGRTIIKDGNITVFNTKGVQMLKEPYEIACMKTFIDSMHIYIDKIKAGKFKINNSKPLLDSVEMISQMKALPNGNIQLESIALLNVCNKNSAELTPSYTKTLIELVPDMTKTLKVEYFNGNQLVLRRVFSYENNNLLYNFHQNTILNENPAKIETFSLEIKPKNKPVLIYILEQFHRNQTIFH